MFARLPITLARAGASATRRAVPAPRARFVRFNSSSSSGANRILHMAAQAEKPSPLEASVPVMWAVCGVLCYAAFSRVEEANGREAVESLLIV